MLSQAGSEPACSVGLSQNPQRASVSVQGFVTQGRAVLGSGVATAAGSVPLVIPESLCSAEQGLPWGSTRAGRCANMGLSGVVTGETHVWGICLQIPSTAMLLWLVLRSSWVAPLVPCAWGGARSGVRAEQDLSEVRFNPCNAKKGVNWPRP